MSERCAKQRTSRLKGVGGLKSGKMDLATGKKLGSTIATTVSDGNPHDRI